jgi:hypothetical protein
MTDPVTKSRFRAHPSVGLLPVSADAAFRTVPYQELPERWRALSDDRQRQAEQRFFSILLTHFSEAGARFTVEFPFPEDVAALKHAARKSSVVLRTMSGQLSGRLGSPLIAALVGAEPVLMEVCTPAGDRLKLHDGWTGVEVTVSPSFRKTLDDLLP